MKWENSCKYPFSLLCPETAPEHTVNKGSQSQKATPGVRGQSRARFPAQNHQVPRVVFMENNSKQAHQHC